MKNKERKTRQGIYLLPNLITSLNLFFGFCSIIYTMKGYDTGRVSNYSTAALFIVLATVIDFLDGMVARLTKTTSQFGLEYDSLADLTTFGVAPALLMYSWGLREFGKAGWLAVFLYFACVAIRLARFNVQARTVEKESFQGMPSPAAAGVIAAIVIMKPNLVVHSLNDSLYICFLPYLLAFLLVSNVKYRNLKGTDLKRKLPFSWLLLMVAYIILIAYKRDLTIFVTFTVYASSGLVEAFVRKVFRLSNVSAKSNEKSITGQNQPLSQ